jgi:ribonuclease BN (tRNA processing enzyme)
LPDLFDWVSLFGTTDSVMRLVMRDAAAVDLAHFHMNHCTGIVGRPALDDGNGNLRMDAWTRAGDKAADIPSPTTMALKFLESERE